MMAKRYQNNPRRITHKQAASLLRDLEILGDLGGIVHNVRDDNADIADAIVGGNQRLLVMFGISRDSFRLSQSDIEIVKEFDEPDEQGTLAFGFILHKGMRYSYRRVSWDEETFRYANLAANARGGHWDGDMLANGGWDDSLLSQFFDDDMLAGLRGDFSITENLLSSYAMDDTGRRGRSKNRQYGNE